MTKQEEAQVINQQLSNIKHNKDMSTQVEDIYKRSNELQKYSAIDAWSKRVELGNEVKDIISKLKFA